MAGQQGVEARPGLRRRSRQPVRGRRHRIELGEPTLLDVAPRVGVLEVPVDLVQPVQVTHEPDARAASGREAGHDVRECGGHPADRDRRRRVLAVEESEGTAGGERLVQDPEPPVEDARDGGEPQRRGGLGEGVVHVAHPLGTGPVGAVLERRGGEEHVQRAVVPQHREVLERPVH